MIQCHFLIGRLNFRFNWTRANINLKPHLEYRTFALLFAFFANSRFRSTSKMAVYRPIEITILGFVNMTPGGAVQIILVLIM